MVWALLIIPHLKTDFMNETVILDTVFNYARVVSGLFIICILLIKMKYKLSFLSSLLFVLQLELLLSTYINQQPLKDALIRVVSIGCLLLLLDRLFTMDCIKTIRVLSGVLSIYIYINFISILLFPNGLYNIGAERKSFFLGHTNQMITYIIPVIILAIIILTSSNYSKNVKINSCIVMVVGIVSEIICWSATAIAGLVILGLLIWFYSKSKIYIFNSLTGFLAGACLVWGIMVFQIQYLFQNIIVNFLHRSLDFTRRIKMWVLTLNYYEYKKGFGYGIEPIEIRKIKVGGPHSHDLYLELLYQGGIIGFAIALVFFGLLYVYMKKYKRNFYARCIAAAIFTCCIMCIVETYYGNAIFYVLLSLGIHSDKIVSLFLNLEYKKG